MQEGAAQYTKGVLDIWRGCWVYEGGAIWQEHRKMYTVHTKKAKLSMDEKTLFWWKYAYHVERVDILSAGQYIDMYRVI